MIHKTDYGAYVISSYHVWRPGSYEDERTARYAFRFTDETLNTLQNHLNETVADFAGRTITFTMLQDARKRGLR